MIRIERTKEGEVQVFVAGKKMELPDKGQCVVLMPQTKYREHLERSSDTSGDTT